VYDAAARHMRGAAAVCNFPGGAFPPALGQLHGLASRVMLCSADNVSFARAETESGFPDCLLSQMPQLVTVAGLQKTGIKRARTAMPQVCACVRCWCLLVVLTRPPIAFVQEHATTKAKAAPCVPAAASPVGVRKSMRFMPFDAMGAVASHDERSLNDAADASAWLLESGALF
jgi:hypothetical protein